MIVIVDISLDMYENDNKVRYLQLLSIKDIFLSAFVTSHFNFQKWILIMISFFKISKPANLNLKFIKSKHFTFASSIL